MDDWKGVEDMPGRPIGFDIRMGLQVAPEHLEAAREAAEKLPAVDISEVDLQWVQVQSLM